MKKTWPLLWVPVLATGCVTHPYDKPFLTPKAFARAAQHCQVVNQGVHHSKGSQVPYADYLIPDASGRARSDEGEHRACLDRALIHYRYDFLGEAIPKDQQ